MERQNRFYVAFALYVVIGLAIWMTIDDIPLPVRSFGQFQVHITLRQLTLGILGLFALRTVLHWRAEHVRATRER